MRKAESDALRADLFDACSVLGVDNLKVGADDDGEPVTYDELCAGFDALADAGREAGVKIAYENTPFSPLPIRHAYCGGTPYDALLRLPPEHLFGVELDDGARTVVGTQIEDTFDNRVFCGTGDFDVVAFVEVVRRLGWDGIWGIEHMSETDRKRPVEVVLHEAREAAADCIARADAVLAR